MGIFGLLTSSIQPDFTSIITTEQRKAGVFSPDFSLPAPIPPRRYECKPPCARMPCAAPDMDFSLY